MALLSPSYFTPMEYVDSAAEVIRGWGFEPVIGPNVGKRFKGKYAGTMEERISDLRWALGDTSIKAIICNRGGYGTIKYIDSISLDEWGAHPKWLVGFSDISTLLGLMNRAGVMSIHGTMGKFIADSGTDDSSRLLRDLLKGEVPCYEVAPHPCNIEGRASGILVGGNLCTVAPNAGSQADATMGEDIILFLEEIEEPLRNIDRQFNILVRNGVLERCAGVVLGEFTDCEADLEYESAEAMLVEYFESYGIPVLCGFLGGHGDVNLPLVMGSRVEINVSRDEVSTLRFELEE